VALVGGFAAAAGMRRRSHRLQRYGKECPGAGDQQQKSGGQSSHAVREAEPYGGSRIKQIYQFAQADWRERGRPTHIKRPERRAKWI